MFNWYKFKEEIDDAPNSEGVYFLSESESEEGIIYIGRADDLNDRISQHPDPNNHCLQRKSIRYFAFEETFDPERREEALIKKYDPECNHTN